MTVRNRFGKAKVGSLYWVVWDKLSGREYLMGFDRVQDCAQVVGLVNKAFRLGYGRALKNVAKRCREDSQEFDL